MKRRAEPRITNLGTHPRKAVSLRVAAIYLEVDEKTLRKWLSSGLLGYIMRGRRRKIETNELAAFEERQRRPGC